MTLIPWKPVDSFLHNTTDPVLTSHRPCPVCGTDRPREILRLDDFQFFTDSATLPKRTTICEVQCAACYALYLNPAYTSRGFEVLFAEAGCSYGATEGRPQEQIRWLTEMGLLNDGSSILDVGCYDGRFLSLLPATVRRIGVDIDNPAIERGRALYGDQGIDLVHGDFNSFQLDRKPDTITMFHVLEHLPSPLATLKNLRNQGHENTSLVVEVPILENGFTNDINSFFSAQHMTHFSKNSLNNVLARAGWELAGQLEQSDYNGYRVLAKPAGTTSQANANPEDDTTLKNLLKHRRDAIDKAKANLATIGDAEKIVVWGGGMHTEFLYHLTDVFGGQHNRQFFIVDSDPLKQGKSWRGINIEAPESISKIDWTGANLLISSYGGQEKIAECADGMGVPTSVIVKVYETIRVY
ncbi:class I SAM-dependent methyltransferase [Geoalkalibacter halelectricus]|uniref:class I SAM-dependent methyltransferase n=1 Tax=Geoalkalibacter halelectricus TaxID=2847045 RepID=UPI003D22D887